MRAALTSGLDAAGTYYSYHAVGLQPLDICDAEKVGELIRTLHPLIIYLPAGLTGVDYCEAEPRATYAINVTGTANVARAASQMDARLVYFSSDYVFDGVAGPYHESDEPQPVCEYGRQKQQAERLIAELVRDPLIIRTSGIYSWEPQRKNFVCRLLDALRSQQHLPVPTDQVGSPTYAPDLAEAVLGLLAHGARGIYNVAGRAPVSRCDFAVAAARVFDLKEDLIVPVQTGQLRQRARRPLNAGLQVEKAEALLGVELLSYREGLRAMADAGTGD